MKTDSELQKDVPEELKWDPQVEHTQIGVTTKTACDAYEDDIVLAWPDNEGSRPGRRLPASSRS